MPKDAQHPNLKSIMENLANTFGMPGLKEWIQNIEDPLDYDDPNERQSVIRRNMDMIQQRMTLLQQFSNVNPDQARQYVDNPGNFDYSEWKKLEELKHDLDDYQESVKMEMDVLDAQVAAAPKDESEEKKQKPKRKVGSYRGWIPS
jgi:hypothetical protein